MYAFAQILGIAVAVLCLLSPHFKKKWQILSVTITANVLSGLHFVLLGEYSATGVSAVAVIQAILEISRRKMNGRIKTAELVSFSLLYLIGGLLPYIVVGSLNGFSVTDVLPIIGALLLMCSMTQLKEQYMRLFFLANAAVFFVYDIMILSSQAFAQLVTIISILTALFRYKKTENSNVQSRYED